MRTCRFSGGAGDSLLPVTRRRPAALATCGTGAPLVKAANWLTHLDGEWDSPIWRHWIQWLAGEHRLVRYDERGSGLSDWDVDDFSLEAWVEDLELVVDSADLDRFPLLGVSQGGAVATATPSGTPTGWQLVLVGAYAGAAGPGAHRGRGPAGGPRPRARPVSWRRDDAAFREVFASQFFPDTSREHWEAFIELQRATTSVENVVRFLEAFARIDVS